MTTTRLLSVLALAAAFLVGASQARADDPKLPDTKTFDKLVIDALRDVHNRGADLYNTSEDHAGAYRMYQGALVTVRPLLAHRPEAQKIIDTGFESADKESNLSRKAFVLHETIEGVRKNLKVAIGERKPDESKKPEDKKPEEKKPDEPKKKPEEKKPEEPKKPVEPPKKPEEKKPEEKKPEEKKPVEKKPDGVALAPMPKDTKGKAESPAANVGGKVTLAGKLLAEGELTIVSLNQPLPRVFTAVIKNGEYKFAEAIPPGKYTGIITGSAVPQKYHLVSTSGLMFEFGAGANTTDVLLK
jgi:hypothetical protein